MGHTSISSGGQTKAYVQEFLLDTDADKNDLPVYPDCAYGSSAISIKTGNIFMLNSENEWAPFAAGGDQ